MLSLYPGRDALRILWGPNHLHQLSGAVTTPLFRHLGLSSWHSVDGAIVKKLKFGAMGHIASLALQIGVIGGVIFAAVRWYRSPARLRRKSLADKHKLDGELLV